MEYQSFGRLPSLPNRLVEKRSCSNNTSWISPLRGTLKINVGAHLSSDDHWFAVMLLRWPDGSAVGAATRSLPRSDEVVLGEALGLNAALDWIEEMGLTNVIFESDSQSIVRAIKEKIDIGKSWDFVVRRCIEFAKANPNLSFAWTTRGGNQAANELARWTELEPNKNSPNNFPSCILPCIQKDIGNFLS